MRVKVDDNGTVQPTFLGPCLSDIRTPNLIRGGGMEVLLNQIFTGNTSCLIFFSVKWEPLQSFLTHQFVKLVATDTVSLLTHLLKHPWQSVGSTRILVNRTDVEDEPIFIWFWPFEPVIISRWRDLHDLAEGSDRRLRLLRRDKDIALYH